jgi:hypothetical protein
MWATNKEGFVQTPKDRFQQHVFIHLLLVVFSQGELLFRFSPFSYEMMCPRRMTFQVICQLTKKAREEATGLFSGAEKQWC